MLLSHSRPVVAATFDEPNLVLAAGLVPVIRLAGAAGLDGLAGELLSVPTDKGANLGGKVTALSPAWWPGRRRGRRRPGCLGARAPATAPPL